MSDLQTLTRTLSKTRSLINMATRLLLLLIPVMLPALILADESDSGRTCPKRRPQRFSPRAESTHPWVGCLDTDIKVLPAVPTLHLYLVDSIHSFVQWGIWATSGMGATGGEQQGILSYDRHLYLLSLVPCFVLPVFPVSCWLFFKFCVRFL